MRSIPQSRRKPLLSGGVTIPVENLVMYLRFNNSLVDETGNITGITDTLTSYTTGIWSGAANEAINCNGTTRRVNIPDNDILSFGDGLTDSPCSFTWGYESLIPSTGGRFISKRGDGTDPSVNKEWEIFFNAGEVDVVFHDNSEATTALIRRRTTTFGIASSTIYHLAVTYDGSGTEGGIKIYKNGVEETIYTNASTGSYTAMENTASAPRIGRAAWSSGIGAAGAYDGVGIWNVELSPEQVLAIYNEQSSGNEIL